MSMIKHTYLIGLMYFNQKRVTGAAKYKLDRGTRPAVQHSTTRIVFLDIHFSIFLFTCPVCAFHLAHTLPPQAFIPPWMLYTFLNPILISNFAACLLRIPL